MTDAIPTMIIPSVQRAPLSPRQVEREFARLIQGSATIQLAVPDSKFSWIPGSTGFRPKHKIELFETQFYLCNVRQMPELRFFVAYVVQKRRNQRALNIYPRIFYKDLSLTWRAASHFTVDEGEIWIGKGDVRHEIRDGHEMVVSDESTTDLPLEMQTALESLLNWVRRPLNGIGILELILRRGNRHRLQAYRDFTEPRRRAERNPNNRINRGEPIARFRHANDPRSLEFVSGFQPDFTGGVMEESRINSKLYGGELGRFRILSQNRKIQYGFISGPNQVWIIPPQALTTELSSYGVRSISVAADDDLFIPGYEYHYIEETERGSELYSQIPNGFAGDICPFDDAKADASPWLDQIPVIQEFRSKILGQR